MDMRIAGLEGGPSAEIELGNVERELAALWAGAAGDEQHDEPAVLRACALNLVVLGRGAEALERARPLAAGTTLARPSRILLVASEQSEPGFAGDPSAPGLSEDRARGVDRRQEIGARISAFCHRTGSGGRHVCCEEITVLARGSAAERLPEAVLPVLLPDMPVHLWLPDMDGQAAGASAESKRELNAGHRRQVAAAKRLAAMADQVIWSARCPRDRIAVGPGRRRPRAVIDLDWMRILPWREMTAQLFDPPERQSLLDLLERVEITVAGPPTPRPGAGWLWIGWLASRLGWEDSPQTHGLAPAEGEPGCIRVDTVLRNVSGPVRVHLTTAAAGDIESGELLAVRLFARGLSQPLTLERLPMPVPAALCISQSSNRCVHLGIRDEAVLLAEALGAGGRDPCYEAAWETAVRLWERCQRASEGGAASSATSSSRTEMSFEIPGSSIVTP